MARFQLLNKLSIRVFITIWISMGLMISLTLLIPKFDQRRALPTPEREQSYYQTKVVHMLFNSPTDRFREADIITDLLVIPINKAERYNVIRNIENEEVVNFIISTLSTNKMYQQEIDDLELIGPIRFERDDNAYYLCLTAFPQQYYLSRLYDTPYLIFLLMLFISLPFAALLSWSLTIPMKNLQRAAERVRKGDWKVDRYLEERGPLEYRYLAKSFNDMVQTLNIARDEKARLFANLSHELRTPLTRIHLANSLIRIKNIDTISNEVQRINDNLLLVEERIQTMLSLAKQTILNEILMEPIELDEILTPLLEDAAFEAEENGKQLLFDPIPNIAIEVNIDLFLSGIENIIRNAIHYAKSQIIVTLSLKNRTLIINVHDDGPGILEQDLPQIFEPFYRGERPEGMKDYGGSGLGLAIVNQMTQLHRGSVKAENNHGLSITLTLPLQQNR